MTDETPINNWNVVQLYVDAKRKHSWIAVISLGYTMLEMALGFLLKSNAGSSGHPVSSADIEGCRYLIHLAVLAKDRGCLPQPIFDEIDKFNKLRIKAIHCCRVL